MKYKNLEKEMGMTDEECRELFGLSLIELWNESMLGLEELHNNGEFLDTEVDFVEL